VFDLGANWQGRRQECAQLVRMAGQRAWRGRPAARRKPFRGFPRGSEA
jgi:hypothetical protein